MILPNEILATKIFVIDYNTRIIEEAENLKIPYVVVPAATFDNNMGYRTGYANTGVSIILDLYSGRSEKREKFMHSLASLLPHTNFSQGKLDKEMYASDYEDELSSFRSFKEVNDNVKQAVEMAINADCSIINLTNHIILSKENPLEIRLSGGYQSRYNGGSFNIEFWYDGKEVDLGDNLYDIISDICGSSFCATITPFYLLSALILCFGNELNFDKFNQDTIKLFKDGHIVFKAYDVNIGPEADGSEFNVIDPLLSEILNKEILRWLNLPKITFAKFVKQALLFIMPLTEDSFSS